MSDFPLLAVNQVAHVDNIDFFGGGSSGILSMDIRGRDFTGLNAVIINGHRSPTFVVLSDTRLLADVPRSQLGGPIRTITVLKSDASTSSEGSVISFEAVGTATVVPSSTFLVQKVLKYLFTTPGSDIFSPTSGSGLLGLLGATETAAESLALLARIRVREALSQIIRDQALSSAPLEEKVQVIEVLSASFSRTDTSLDIRLAVISMAGQRVVAGLTI